MIAYPDSERLELARLRAGPFCFRCRGEICYRDKSRHVASS